MLAEDLVLAKPTFFVGVPRVYQKFQDKILAGVEQAGGIKKWLFNKAYAAKADALAKGEQPPWLWEKLVFSKIRQAFGGRIDFASSGSAPLSVNSANFIRTLSKRRHFLSLSVCFFRTYIII